ncbi:hypothetical protein ACP275_06G059200 [Erythranthe tilingii]
MAHRRKRVHAIHRGPDGSAFHKCGSCGISVPIALGDMHECEFKKKARKKLKIPSENGDVTEQSIQDQPRSAFHFFMEEFTKTCKDENELEIDKKGFETWKNMSVEERQPFVVQADKVNSAYEKLLHKEEQEIQWIDDEADSAEAGNLEENYEGCDLYYGSESFDGIGFSLSGSHWTFDSEDPFRRSWLTKKAP